MAFTPTGNVFDDGIYTTVGDTGVGTLTVTGGVYARNSVVVGNQVGGVGTLSLLAGAQVDVGIFGFLVGWKGRGTATISAGSIVNSTSDSYGNVEIGSHKGSVGNLTVTGAYSQLNALSLNASVTVGAQGDGTLTVSNGGAVNVTGSNATLFVSGAWDVGLGLPTALLAQSELLITTGGVVTVNDTGAGYDTVNVGSEKFGNGAIRVSGVGSKLVSIGTAEQDQIIIGNRGVGLLTIATDGEVVGRRMMVGNDLGGIGNLQISGAGSKLTLASDAVYGAPYTGAGLWVGNRGNGTMTVSSLATVGITGDRAQIHVGDGFGNTVAGAVGVLNIQSGGVVTVDHGPASLFNTTVFIGQNLNSVGTINVTGAGSKLVSIGSKDEITVGEQGKGTLIITAGGAVEGQRMFVGANFGGTSLASVGTVVVDGVGSRITFASPAAYDPAQYQARIDVGRAGSGTMTVRNNATLSMTGAQAELLVGNGQELLAVGPTGVMNIQSGGVVTVDHGTDPSAGFATIQIGANQFGTGTLNITGANSKLISLGNRDEILVGNHGKGTLNVTAGGQVQGQLMFVGANETGNGNVVVDGAASKITLVSPDTYSAAVDAAELFVGGGGNGTMTVRAGATVSMTGAQAHLFVGDGFGLSSPGAGLLTIQSGGKVVVNNTDTASYGGAIDIGVQSTGSGTITLTGAGSTLTTQGTDPFIAVGNNGTGVLNVQAGGKVLALGMSVGLNTGGNGTLNISGAGSKVVLSNDTFTPGIPGHDGETYAGSLTVGDRASSTGTMNITAGGVLEIRNSATGGEVGPFLGIGNRDGSIGVVTVDGAGSAINMKQTNGDGPEYGPFLGVGNRGDGTLTVRNSAQINLTGEYGQFRVSRGNDVGELGAPAEAPLSEAFILSGADVTINMSGGVGYGAVAKIAQESNSNGRLTIDGTGSTLNVLGNNLGNLDSERAVLLVAQRGEGELIISGGADVFINGGDDKRPLLAIGLDNGSNGDLSITGVGSTLNLLTTNTTVDGGGLITVSRLAGSRGALNISTGAQVINDLGSNNSVMTVGQSYTSVGEVIVNGNGNVTTLLDAGQLLVVGADWNELGATLGDVGFTGGGTGILTVLNGATVRANDTAVGIGGTVGGNGKFDGNVTVDGGALVIGTSPGILTVTGALTVSNTNLDFEVNGLTAGTLYDQLKVTGAVTIVNVNINLNIDGTTFSFVDGNRVLLIDGVAPLLVDINAVNVAITNEPAGLAYSVADEGADLVFEALNNGAGAALVSFGATSTIGATATIDNGVVTGTGGRFNSVRSVGATGIEGTAGADNLSDIGNQVVTLLGLAGNDVLSGGTLGDTLDGGLGIDTVTYVNAGGAVTVVLGGAVQTFNNGETGESDSLKGFENIVGSGFADNLTGDGLANVIDGGGDADIMAGGLGNDTYVVDSLGDAITDTGGIELVRSSITYSLATSPTLENLTLLASFGDLDATGNALANILTGNEGNNRLNGGALADTMIGGLGNDTYVVDVATDKVTELAGGGTDSIETSLAAYSLAALAEVENLTYTGISAFTGTGNAKNNIIIGQSGADKLNGGLGADTLVGGLGNDTYIVDNAGDIVNETDGDGLDLVQSSVTFNLTVDGIITFGIIDNLTLTGALAINGTGNAEANTIVGNTGANVIEGKGIAADILDGGAGLDTLSYASSGAGVTVTLNGATEVTQAGAGDAAGDKTKNFENIIGSAGIDTLTGDTLANVIEGGAGADILDGKAGLDTLSYASSGAGVTVTLNGATEVTQAGAGDAAGDKTKNFENIIGSAHDDSLTGDGLANILTGGAGDDRLDGGVGVDTMIGGLGDDTYVVGIATDKVTELAGAGSGIDTIETSLATYSLNVAALLQVENLTYDNGVAVDVAFTGTGNALANAITGGTSADKLTGGLGNDTLTGGLGNDQFIFADVVAGDFGADSIADFTGGAGVGDVVQIGNTWGYVNVAAVLADLQIVGADMVLDVDPNTSITFVGKAGLVFAADDFLII